MTTKFYATNFEFLDRRIDFVNELNICTVYQAFKGGEVPAMFLACFPKLDTLSISESSASNAKDFPFQLITYTAHG